MFDFRIVKKSKKSRARLGILETSHGVTRTPSLVPVATQATIKALASDEVLQTKSQILICNTYHLHLKPGEQIVKKSGGLHTFMNWPRPLMTDSGGFQVFSLGFGHDLQIGKTSKNIAKSAGAIKQGAQPKNVKITEDGVSFRSPVDGVELFLGPKESIKIQEFLGADIIFAFDECPPPNADRAYLEKSLARTHRWAKTCLETKKSGQALFGIVQGGKYKDLRQASAKFISSLPFDGFGLGGEFGADKDAMISMVGVVNQILPEGKPRHLLGIGYLEDIPRIIKAGVDLFDCTVPTHYARHNVAFTAGGKLNMASRKFLKELKPLDSKCACPVCHNYTRSYIAHLVRAKEITGLKLLTLHNLYFFNTYVERLRQEIKNGKI